MCTSAHIRWDLIVLATPEISVLLTYPARMCEFSRELQVRALFLRYQIVTNIADIVRIATATI